MSNEGNIVLNISQNAGTGSKKFNTKTNKKAKVLKFKRQRDFDVKIKNSYVSNRPVLNTSDFVKKKENDKSQNSTPKAAFPGHQQRKKPKPGFFGQPKDGMKPNSVFSGHPKEAMKSKPSFSDRSKEAKPPMPGFPGRPQEKKPKPAFISHPQEKKQSKPTPAEHSQEKKTTEFSQQKKTLIASELKQHDNTEKNVPFASFVKREKKTKLKKTEKKEADIAGSSETKKQTTAIDDNQNSENAKANRPSTLKSDLKTKKIKRLQQSTAGNPHFEMSTNKNANKKGNFQQSHSFNSSERGFQQFRKEKQVKHFSSLFHNNPEIPEIHLKAVTQSNERVFANASEDFDHLDIHPFLKSNVKQNLKLEKMTAIQQKAIPAILAQKDVLLQSQTGSGKTLAYAIPLVHKLQAIQPEITRASGPVAVVLVPTRELAI